MAWDQRSSWGQTGYQYIGRAAEGTLGKSRDNSQGAQRRRADQEGSLQLKPGNHTATNYEVSQQKLL